MSKHDKGARQAGSKEDREGDLGDLPLAALALERELRRFEELSTAARRLPIDTHKGIERAAKITTEAAAGQERVDAALHALVDAIKAARDRHEANGVALQARGEEIRARAEQFGSLYERYVAFGEEGKAINQLVQSAAARQGDATTPEGIRELVDLIASIEDRMSKLVEGARELSQVASAASISDLAEQADSLRQQVAAARNKVGLLRKNLVGRLPDPSTLN